VTADGAATRAGVAAIVADEECWPTCGHPWNDTNALANRNIRAAPASSDPAVPKPAAYALVARMSQRPVPVSSVSRFRFLTKRTHFRQIAVMATEINPYRILAVTRRGGDPETWVAGRGPPQTGAAA
jgi:hypothetical protein